MTQANRARPSSFFLLIVLLSCVEARSQETNHTTATNTHFFQQFSSTQFPEKYAKYFDRVTKQGSRNGLIFSQPTSNRRDTFKDFKISGIIDADQLQRLLDALKTELTAVIEQGGATSDPGVQSNISDRPIYLLAYLFADEVNCRLLDGFYLPYSQGELRGEIDVFVARGKVGDQVETTLTCAVHEPTRRAEQNADAKSE